MRALWVHNFPPKREGSGVFMHTLAHHVCEAGVRVDLHYTGSLRNPARLPLAAFRVRSASSCYDIVHSQFGSACGWVASYAIGPKMLSLRGTDLIGSHCGAFRSRLHGRFARRMTRLSLGRYDEVVVMSKRMGGDLRRIYGYDRGYHVIPSGIDLRRFRPAPRDQARAKLGFDGDTRPWVLFSSVTRGNDVKRPWLASAAIDAARRVRPEITMQRLTGVPPEEVPLWINASDAVLLTSTHEGWPNIIKEALACDTPFISTDVSDLRPIADVEPSCIIAESNEQSLAGALLETLAQPRPVGLRRHVSGMQASFVAKRLVAAYRDLIEGVSGFRIGVDAAA